MKPLDNLAITKIKEKKHKNVKPKKVNKIAGNEINDLQPVNIVVKQVKNGNTAENVSIIKYVSEWFLNLIFLRK